MTDTSSSRSAGASIPAQSPRRAPEPTGWVGWIVFASTMLALIGVLHVIDGLVALFKHSYYVVTDRGLVISVDYTAWGWTHLVVGVVVLAASAGLLSGRIWARTVAVLIACVSLLVNFLFVPAYPVWSIIMITIDVLVIYALTAHGREMRVQ